MASYTTDRPSSPSFVPFAPKPLPLDLIGVSSSLGLDKMSSPIPDASSAGVLDTLNGVANQLDPGPVLPPPSVLPTSSIGGFPNDPASPVDLSGLSPEVVARLEHIVNNFRSLNGNGFATGTLSAPSSQSSLPPATQGLLSSLGAPPREDSYYLIEKRRHDDTKELLSNAEQRIESLLMEQDEHNGIMEDFRIDNRDLKDQLEARDLEIDNLHKHIAQLGHVDQQLQMQIARQQTLEMHLQIEREGRKAVDDELTVSRRAHGSDLQKLDVERKQHAATTAVVEKQSEEIRELQQQLDAANKRVAARDRMLADAEAEKRTLQATVFDARHNIEETAAVFGEASLAFNTEVDRLMNTLLSMKLSATPRAVLPVQTPQPTLPSTPTLPPTPPRR
ncbi:uncharacterized protein SPSK_09428 [Sporothrix schenckii 1099-18]|uniref:Uncharacterized protein n=2 Tax=Sporothrix schenckii TaxID=29908 RepID=U7PYT9_SPOS1|nr:uncharacterized protein SPSK_09428 [Sporothrix schenckii 1099-18]ERS99640.1 hypothetical protein HMPREF1624_03000 [Sporothrix schenckii ATCC 58251]KJR86008.1 hypothetical protein SPSK_09428 [Sporothrix schenckii 1099-18]